MEVEVEEKRRKTKIIGIRLYKDEYDLISAIAEKKRQSRSFVAESLIRSAMSALKSNAGQKRDRRRA